MLRQAFHSGAREIDNQAEEEIRKILTAGFPQYGYLGEELGFVSAPQDSAGHLWLVDPDDGTAAFEKGFRGASVSIALLREGRPVLGVVYAYCAPDDVGDCFTWAEGTGPVRRNGRDVPGPGTGVPETVLVSHQADRNPHANATPTAPMRFRAVPSIAYRLALVAAGEARAAVSLNGPVGWDYAGGHALLWAPTWTCTTKWANQSAMTATAVAVAGGSASVEVGVWCRSWPGENGTPRCAGLTRTRCRTPSAGRNASPRSVMPDCCRVHAACLASWPETPWADLWSLKARLIFDGRTPAVCVCSSTEAIGTRSQDNQRTIPRWPWPWQDPS